jgi:hypothetical protein
MSNRAAIATWRMFPSHLGTGGSTLALGGFSVTETALDHVERKALFLAVKYLAIQVGVGI